MWQSVPIRSGRSLPHKIITINAGVHSSRVLGRPDNEGPEMLRQWERQDETEQYNDLYESDT